MPEPQQDYWSVIAGTDLDEVYDILDRETGDFVDWNDGSWEVEAVIRDRNGEQVARIANFGTRDGEATLLADGRLQLNLPAAVTAELPITRTYTNSTDPRVAAWKHRGALPFELIATETVTTDVSGLVIGELTVNQSTSE